MHTYKIHLNLTLTHTELHKKVLKYPSTHHSKHREPQGNADSGQQVAPHVDCLIVYLEEAEEVEAPGMAHGPVARQDVGLTEEKGDLSVSDGVGKRRQRGEEGGEGTHGF